jgi:HEAT repeat protein
MTTDADARLQKLIRRLHSPDLVKLGAMGPEARGAVPALLRLLHDESAPNRKLAAWTLGCIGPGAAEAVPALLVALRDSHEGVRKVARKALDQIGPPGRKAKAA